jgi:hypothetical protein
MTDKQENLYSMFIVLLAYLTKWIAVVNSIPAFKRACEKFGVLVADIKDVDSQRPSIKTGKADIKTEKKNALANAINQAASALYTYAHENNKQDILKNINTTENYYKRMRDTNLLGEAVNIVKLTAGLETELADHGLTAEEIAAITTCAAEFKTALEDMGTSEAEGTTATKSVYQLIGEAKELIEHQLNVHAEKFKTKNADFYNGYLTASRVIDTGVRHEKKDEGTTTQGNTAADGTSTGTAS